MEVSAFKQWVFSLNKFINENDVTIKSIEVAGEDGEVVSVKFNTINIRGEQRAAGLGVDLNGPA